MRALAAMRKNLYYVINLIVAMISLAFLVRMFQNLQVFLEPIDLSTWLLSLCEALLCAGLVHLLKGLRLYLISMEKCISLKRFLKIYTKTTLVTLVLPWKTGEFFRIFCLGEEMKDYHSGFLSVLVDRYFDSLPLVIVIIIYSIVDSSGFLVFTWVLLFFIISTTLCYLIFPSLYQYFNRFIIMRITSKGGIVTLGILEKLRQWHSYAEQLVKGRGVLLLTLSFGAWIIEYITLNILSACFAIPFEAQQFIHYLNHIFSGAAGELEISYAFLLAGVASLLYIVACAGSIKRNKEI